MTCLAVFVALVMAPASAQALKGGILDPSFGSGGFATVSTVPQGSRESGNAMVVDAQNRVLVGGTSRDKDPGNPVGGWILVRFKSNGTLDTGFGEDGFAKAPGLFGPNLAEFGQDIRALALVPGSDKIVAGGMTIGPSKNSEFTVARYNGDGSLDMSFGPADTGFVRADVSASLDDLKDIAVAADGSITAVGAAGLDAALVRWDSDGLLDPSFDGPGVPGNGMFVDSPSTGFDDYRGILLEPSGAVRAVGVASIGPEGNWLIAHYSPTGARETSFNGSGVVITDFEGQSDLGADLILVDDTLYAFGSFDIDPGPKTQRDFGVAAFDPLTGREFPGTRTLIPLPDTQNMFAAALQRLGGSREPSAERFLLVGTSSTLARMRRVSGSSRALELDPEFGAGGVAPVPATPSGIWHDVAVDGQNRVVTGGSIGIFETADFAAARFLEEAPGATRDRDTVAPVITGAGVSPRAWALKPAGVAEVPLIRRPKRGTNFSYTLSEPARIAFRIERRAPGRKTGGKCGRVTAQNRAKPPCARFVAVGAFAQEGQLGSNRKPFSGRIGEKSLPPAPYRVTLIATDPAGNESAPARLSFKIVPAKKATAPG